jgi:hypothetical protein
MKLISLELALIYRINGNVDKFYLKIKFTKSYDLEGLKFL